VRFRNGVAWASCPGTSFELGASKFHLVGGIATLFQAFKPAGLIKARRRIRIGSQHNTAKVASRVCQDMPQQATAPPFAADMLAEYRNDEDGPSFGLAGSTRLYPPTLTRQTDRTTLRQALRND